MMYTEKRVAKIISYITNNEPPCEIDETDNMEDWCELACGEVSFIECWCRWLEVMKNDESKDFRL